MSDDNSNQNQEQKKCPQCGAILPSGVLTGLCPACLFKQGAAADTVGAADMTQFQPPSVEEVAVLFPQLEILALLGKGGMGAVYKARQPGLDRVVALKILPPQTAGGPSFIERFNREARALARLNHPNIVAVFEFGQANGLPFFIMEFVDGLNLRQLEQAGKLSAREALQIVPQICEALQFAHDEGIVHRDIKPENILVDKKGRVKIADFGIAKILGREQDVAITETGGAIGTPHYMAPEQMEKPTTVDHRADIFSLGVVFYEMLTGELPLGKFSPPSSRKVEVDIRLDDVVLRALEKDPERRYQHASQVKFAVDTIVGTKPPPMADAAAFAQKIIEQDYELNIGSCVRRGWALLKSDFWPLVGITALVITLISFAGSIGGNKMVGNVSVQVTSVLTMLVWGPLMGGLNLYFLKKIRREKTTVEIAFSGFNHRFLHLFLAGFVTSLLTWLGFLCLIFPGIYLVVAWMFTLPLVIDKQLDFWPAMELSRKMVTKHWWKFLGLAIVLLLLTLSGILMCLIGAFVMMPLAIAASLYAYEDVFGNAALLPPSAATGPSGTVVMPPSSKPNVKGSSWTTATKIGLAAVALAIVVIVVMSVSHRNKPFIERISTSDRQDTHEVPLTAMASSQSSGTESVPALVFGPVIERTLQAVGTGTNQFLNLGSEQILTTTPEITDALGTNQPGVSIDRAWLGLDIPKDSHRYQYISWLKENGVDLTFAGDGKIIGFDGVFAVAHGNSATNWDKWDGLTPSQVQAAVDLVDWERRASEAQAHGLPMPAPPTTDGSSYASAMQLDSQESGGPVVSLLTREQSVNWFFKTRAGRMGILQIARITDQPSAVQIRYKLLQPNSGEVTSAEASETESGNLINRLEAATSMSGDSGKNKLLEAIAVDAAKGGVIEIAKTALSQIDDQHEQDETAHEVGGLLSKRGLKKQAIEIAKAISDPDVRNQALSELAQ